MSENRVVSFSEIDSARQCPHKHDLQYKQRWTPAVTSPALQRGTAWHHLMEIYYNGLLAGKEPGVIMKEVTPCFYDDSGEQNEVQGLLEWMFQGYLEQWGEAEKDWKILAVEHEAVIPLGPGFDLKMKIDLIVRVGKRLWLVDHKTCQNLPTEKELELDVQFGLYTWGMRQLGKPIHGAIYSASRTQRNKTPGQALEDRFSRTLLYRTDAELDTIAKEAYLSVQNQYNWKEGTAPRHPNPDTCRWRCPYLEPCYAGMKIGVEGERRFLVDTGFTQSFERH